MRTFTSRFREGDADRYAPLLCGLLCDSHLNSGLPLSAECEFGPLVAHLRDLIRQQTCLANDPRRVGRFTSPCSGVSPLESGRFETLVEWFLAATETNLCAPHSSVVFSCVHLWILRRR